MPKIKELFENNKKWAQEISKTDPEFFPRLSELQSPDYLWIGCSDSRIPANEILGVKPGEVFVHRNIANMVIHSDLNCLSVIQYAVDVLKVKHIIVCGHYGCGGVQAFLGDGDNGLVDNWLNHLGDTYRAYKQELEGLDDEKKRVELLCELNIAEQVNNICNTTILRGAWKRGQSVTVHGWIYQLCDGILKDLQVSRNSNG